jgi:prepilin-type N-terminal cleavage/methylation domain-containing protein
MKLNITPRTKRKSGMTLLELTVVILVLLSLISILFIGARAWKRGSDRSGCLIVIRNVQVAMRGDQNMRNSAPGAPGLLYSNIIGDAAYIRTPPKCPSDKTTLYTYIGDGNYPVLGKPLYATCAQAENAATHVFTDEEAIDL